MIEESIRYIKIPKLDSNDNDISATLNNLTTIIVPLNSTSETKQFNVLARTEFETYYLFNVTADDQDIPTGDKTKIEEYIFSGSMNTGSFEVIKAFTPYFDLISIEHGVFDTTASYENFPCIVSVWKKRKIVVGIPNK